MERFHGFGVFFFGGGGSYFLPCTFEIAVYDLLTICCVTFQVPYIER